MVPCQFQEKRFGNISLRKKDQSHKNKNEEEGQQKAKHKKETADARPLF